MNCNGARELLEAGARTLTGVESARLDAHVQECESCEAHRSGIEGTLAAPAKSSEVELPEVSRDNYEFGGVLARGGMGRISRARDQRLGRDVAVKEVLGGMFRARFEREAMITARLQHPAIIPIYEAGVWPDGSAFYTMRLVSGVTLADGIEGAASLVDRLGLIRHLVAVTDALAFAHSKAIIHRDLKPLNILIGEFGETVVIDWGLARELDAGPDDIVTAVGGTGGTAQEQGLTQTGAVLGTPCYMAPEQAAGAECDRATDVYALGAILYTILVGKAPYKDTHDGVVAGVLIDAVLGEPPTAIPNLEPSAPPDLVAIAERAMTPNRADRYASAKEMADELHRFEAGQLIASRRYSRRALLARWVKRHRAAVAVAAVAALVVAIGTVLSVARIAASRDSERDARVVAERAKAVAEERASELILGQARSSLATDPTASLAWLRDYPESGPGTIAAGLVTADAIEHGVSWRVLAAPSGETTRVQFVDGENLLVASSDISSARAWNLETGQTIDIPGVDSEEVWLDQQTNSLVFPKTDSIGVHQRSLRPDASDQPGTDLELLPGRVSVYSFHYDPAGRRALIEVDGDAAVVWDHGSKTVTKLAVKGEPIALIAGGRQALIEEVRFKPVLVDIASGKRLATFNAGQLARLYGEHFAISPTQPLVLATSPTASSRLKGRGVRLVTAPDTEPLTFFDGREAQVVKFSPRGAELAVGFADGRVAIIDVKTQAVRCDWSTGTRLTSMAYGAEKSGKRVLVIGARDGTVRVASECGVIERTLRGHRNEVASVALSDDGQLVASASADQNVRVHRRIESTIISTNTIARPTGCDETLGVRRTSQWAWLYCIEPEPTQWGGTRLSDGKAFTNDLGSSPLFSLDGSTMAGYDGSSATKVFRAGKLVSLPVKHKLGQSLSQNGERLYSFADNVIQVWDVGRQTIARRIAVKSEVAVASPDESAIVVDNATGVGLIDIDGTTLAQEAKHAYRPIAEWAENSRVFAIPTGERNLAVYDRDSKEWDEIATSEYISSFMLSARGRWVALSLENTFLLVDRVTGARVSVGVDRAELYEQIFFSPSSPKSNDSEHPSVVFLSPTHERVLQIPAFSHRNLDVATNAVINRGRPISASP